MKKTLLIAAAALAASVISSQAQVYSQNVVGYANIPETAGQISLEAPAFDLDGTGTNNTIATVYPNPSIGDQVYIYNGAGFDGLSYQVKNVGTRTSPLYVTNWFDGNGNLNTNYPINVGSGVFYLPAINETNTFVGQVLNGSVTNEFLGGSGIIDTVSSQIPYAGGLTSVLNYQPNIGDQVYQFSAGAYNGYTFQVKNTGTRTSPVYVTNWFDGNGNQNQPLIGVGQSFWLLPAANNTWVETFTNN